MAPGSLAPFRALVFDLDGTLLDTHLDIAHGANAARESEGLEPLSAAAILSMVGHGARRLIEQALGTTDPARVDAGLTHFRRAYGAHLVNFSTWYPGMQSLLQFWSQRVPVGVLTNKPEEFTQRISVCFGLRRNASLVFGPETSGARKPDPAGLIEMARRWKLNPADLVMIGDHTADSLAAQAAGSQAIHVSWGYGEYREDSVNVRVHTADELHRVLLEAGS